MFLFSHIFFLCVKFIFFELYLIECHYSLLCNVIKKSFLVFLKKLDLIQDKNEFHTSVS